MDKATALRKIQKCLRLAESCEPHEAARAMQQAQALMRQFGIEHPELFAAGAQPGDARSRATQKPPAYEASLAHTVASSFECDVWFFSGRARHHIPGRYRFVGVGPKAEVASYTFTVLARQLKQARAHYTATALKRHRKNKVAAADLFCEGWVWAVRSATVKPVRSLEDTRAITAWCDVNLVSTGEFQSTSRELSNRGAVQDHHRHGYNEGKKARVHAGVGADRAPQLGLAS